MTEAMVLNGIGRCFVAVAVGCALIVACQAGENLAKNGDFERGDAFWKNGPWGNVQLSELEANRDDQIFHDAKSSLRLIGRYANAYQRIKIPKAGSYTLGGWIKPGGVPRAGLYAWIYKPGGARPKEVPAGFVSGKGEWQYVETALDCDKGDTVCVGLFLPDGESGRAWFDGVFLEERPNTHSNLLKNSGFSSCANPGIPDFWGVGAQITMCVEDWEGGVYYGVEKNGESPIHGTKALRLYNPGAYPFYVFSAKYLTTLPQSKYTLSAWLRSDKDNLPVSISPKIGGGDKKFEVGKEWKRYSWTTDMGQEGYMSIRFDAPGTLWVAAPQLEAGIEATAHKPSPFDAGVAASAAAPDANTIETPTISCPRTSAPPVIDGKLDDECWGKAAVAKDFKNINPAEKTGVATQAFVTRDDERLYVAFKCEEPDMDKAQTAPQAKNEQEVFKLDTVEVFLTTHPGLPSYFHLASNMAGEVYDAISFDPGWESGCQAKASRADKAWTVEMAIPLSKLEMSGEDKTWKINFCRGRNNKGKAESFSWAHPDGFHKPEYFGTMALPGYKELERYFWSVDDIAIAKKPDGQYALTAKVLSPELYSGRNVEASLEYGGNPSVRKQAGGDSRRFEIVFDNLPGDILKAKKINLGITDLASGATLASIAKTPIPLIDGNALNKGGLLEAFLQYSYYTDDKTAALMVIWKGDEATDCEVKVEPLGRKGNNALFVTALKSCQGKQMVSLPLSALGDGTYKVTVSTTCGKRGGAVVSDVLVKLPPNSMEVRTDRFRRCFVINGEPFTGALPQLFTAEFTPRQLKKYGFKAAIPIVHLLDKKEIEDFERYLDDCDSLGIKVVVWIGLVDPYREDIKKVFGKFEIVKERVAKIIHKYKAHPAVLAWYFIDEPAEGNWEKTLGFEEYDLIRLYEFIKTLDPYRPVVVNWIGGPWMSPTEIYGSLNCADMVGIDFYPLRPIPSPQPMKEFSRSCMKFSGLVAAKRAPLLYWVQAYGFHDAGREPTPDELKCMVYLGMVYGVRTIAYFMAKPMYAPLWAMECELNQQMEYMGRKVFFPNGAEEIKHGVLDNSVHYSLWRSGDDYYLIAANDAYKPAELSMDLSNIGDHGINNAETLFDNVGIELKDSVLTDRLGPVQGRIYHLKHKSGFLGLF